MPHDRPPLLDVARVRNALAGTPFADVRYTDETGSTNDDAAPLLGDSAARGAVLVAEHQNAGKGRKPGRRWIAPPGRALTFTAVLPRTVAAAALWAVPFWVALAVADGVEGACGVRLDLRWPNDLDLDGRKAGGILCVSRVGGDEAFVACGIGLNVLRPEGDDLREIEPPPAFLSDRVPHVEREDVLAGILAALGALLDVLDAPTAVARAWESRADLYGRPYALRLDADGSLVEGTAVRLDAEGGLVLQTPHGLRSIHLADARVVGEVTDTGRG